jgi:hypothetical protein
MRLCGWRSAGLRPPQLASAFRAPHAAAPAMLATTQLPHSAKTGAAVGARKP